MRYVIALVAALSAPTALATVPVPGGVYVWPLPEKAHDISFQGRPVLTVSNHVIVGIPIGQKPGSAVLIYHVGEAPRSHTFEVHEKQYTEQHITLENQDMVTPPEATLTRIREEARRQGVLYRAYSPPRSLQDGFIKPLEGITSSLFGHRRFFNGQPRSPHSGLDIAADTGTPVAAAGDARVVLADDLYFNGNTVFLDHGQGLVTMYCHLSEILVAQGEDISQGQEIGRVGATGRVTGPHLHWSVSLNGSRIDPESFMQALNELTR